MWQNYSRWTGEARERYEGDVQRLSGMRGISEQARASELAAREQAFSKEMRELEGGATAGQLREHWREAGGGKGTMEEFLAGRYGGSYQGGQRQPAAASEAAGGARRAGMPGAQAMAPIAGVGEEKPWWAL